MAYRGLSECLKYAWGELLKDSNNNSKSKVSVIALISDIYEKRMNLCTNANVIHESLSYVEQAKKSIMYELNKTGEST
jgi:hypothetical protein